MFKDFLMRKMLKRQGASDAQVDQMLEIINKNPELFKKIGAEVEVRTKRGENQTQATMAVMKQYQNELRKLK